MGNNRESEYRNDLGSHLDSESYETTENVKASMMKNDKLQGSSTIIFSIANTMMGPSLLLLPLKFVETGLLSSIVVAFVIALISYRTCNLTHMHTKMDEIEYISAIDRIMGKSWNLLYFVNSVIILWMAGIIYFLSLCDVTYSLIQMAFNVTFPPESSIVWDEFSYQYIGIIIMALTGWLFFLKKLGKILDLTEKGIYSIIMEGIFLLYLGFKALFSGNVHFAFHTDDPSKEVGLTTSASLQETVGVFAMAFAIHNSIVAIVRKSRNPAKNSTNVGYAYLLTFLVYAVTGIFGAIGLYTKIGENPNTVLNNKLYQDRSEVFTIVMLVITQLLTAFQLVTVLPVVNNIVRNQIFIMMYGEDGHPPKTVFYLFNFIYIFSFLVVQIFNISPNTVMKYAGAFIGFVIIYLLPVVIHLKALRTLQTVSRDTSPLEAHEKRSELKSLPTFMKKRENINYTLEYGAHGLILAVGVTIFISQLVQVFIE